jgi:hypothetical protein
MWQIWEVFGILSKAEKFTQGFSKDCALKNHALYTAHTFNIDKNYTVCQNVQLFARPRQHLHGGQWNITIIS